MISTTTGPGPRPESRRPAADSAPKLTYPRLSDPPPGRVASDADPRLNKCRPLALVS